MSYWIPISKLSRKRIVSIREIYKLETRVSNVFITHISTPSTTSQFILARISLTIFNVCFYYDMVWIYTIWPMTYCNQLSAEKLKRFFLPQVCWLQSMAETIRPNWKFSMNRNKLALNCAKFFWTPSSRICKIINLWHSTFSCQVTITHIHSEPTILFWERTTILTDTLNGSALTLSI